MRRVWSLLLPLVFLARPLQAQTLRDSLQEQVREGIDASRDKKKRDGTDEEKKPDDAAGKAAPPDEPPKEPPPAAADKPKAPEKPEPDEAKPEGTTLFSFDSERDALEEPAEPDRGPKLPVRSLGEDWSFDITVGGGYRGWFPQQYDAVDVDIGSYATWSVDVRAKLFGLLNVRRGYYESNGLSGPRTEEAAVAEQIGQLAPKAAWLLGAIGVPIGKAWEPVVRYESRAFETRAQPQQPVCIVPRDAPADLDLEACTPTMEELRIISTFETFVAGVRYDHMKTNSAVVGRKGGKIPPIFFGVGLMQYRKPYQITIDKVVIDDFLFDGRFRGAGLALGTDMGGGIDWFFADVDLQLGLGEISLLQDLTLNELAPSNDWLIGYVQGSATLGYRWPILRAAPTLTLVPEITAGGASFFLFETQLEEGEEGATVPVNWDFLWAAKLSLLIPI